MDNSSDEKLMQLVLERNADALKTLYNRYSMAVFNFTLRYTGSRELSEDLLQETFSRCWFAAHTFKVNTSPPARIAPHISKSCDASKVN